MNSERLMSDVRSQKFENHAYVSILLNGLQEVLAMDIVRMSPIIRYQNGDKGMFFSGETTFCIMNPDMDKAAVMGLEDCILQCRETAAKQLLTTEE
jgi:hypothetical protein